MTETIPTAMPEGFKIPVGTTGADADGNLYTWDGTEWRWSRRPGFPAGRRPELKVSLVEPVTAPSIEPEATVALTEAYPCIGGPESEIHVPTGEDGEPVELVSWRDGLYERVRSTSGGDWVYVRRAG